MKQPLSLENSVATLHQDYEYPLRDRRDVLKCLAYLCFFPILLTAGLSALGANLLFPDLSLDNLLVASLLHIGVLLLFLLLLWIPVLLAMLEWDEVIETSINYFRNVLLVLMILAFFPHELIRQFLQTPNDRTDLWQWYKFGGGAVIIAYITLSFFSLHKTAHRDIRAARAPQERQRPRRWLAFDTATFLVVLAGTIVLEWWFLAAANEFSWQANPIKTVFEQHLADVNDDKAAMINAMRLTAYGCYANFTAIIFFLSACLGNRIMHAILIPVTFHERDIKGIVGKGYSYLKHFAFAMYYRHPLLLTGGLVLTLVFLLTPIIFVAAGKIEMLDNLIEADQVILALVVFMAWFSPLVNAAIHPDETYGDYFNQRIANHLMMIQGHVVYFGFGNLGKRVIDRDCARLWQHERDDHFFQVVTPDVRLEWVCSHLVVIDRNPSDMIYSNSTSLLGSYGVVGSFARQYKSKDQQGNTIHPEKRVLVPMVVGEAKEPFISSRVNLERAGLIISTVPDEESVQTIFERATRSNVRSIICVSRSDQVAYLTYRARHRRIVLVYPQNNQGNTLGHRLWSTILKIRAHQQMAPRDYPKVLVIGNSKANHYMMETLWTYLPGNHKERSDIVRNNFRFILMSPVDDAEFPEPKARKTGIGAMEKFDLYIPSSYVTSGRYPYPLHEDDAIELINLQTRMINDADAMALEACIEEAQPEIIVINLGWVEKSSMIFSRCMRALERLKSRGGSEFQLPIFLHSTPRGDERDYLILGDASRYYDALCRLYQQSHAFDLSYPAPTRFDHYLRSIVGETISDALADAEEIIAGAKRSFTTNSVAPGEESDDPNRFIEISGCLPNHPSAQADYVARLAGLHFEPCERKTLLQIWPQPDSESKKIEPHVPCFQYLRNIILGPEGSSFTLTGYAALMPADEQSPIFHAPVPGESLVTRIFANDGRNYHEKEVDPLELYQRDDLEEISAKLRKLPDPEAPGVPEVIDRLTGRKRGAMPSVADFKQILLDEREEGKTGECACPGMSGCRIAAFQDYVTASNNLRIGLPEKLAAEEQNRRLWHAKNYYCSTAHGNYTTAREYVGEQACYARVFCCSHTKNDPGMIALVLNALIFRYRHTREARGSGKANDWIVNIEYFKDFTCQNANFSLNRLFGNFQKKPAAEVAGQKLTLPIQVIRILPIGSVESARRWYEYGRALYAFLNQHEKFQFYWMDQDRNRHRKIEDRPDFSDRRGFPILIVIKKHRTQEERDAVPPDKCRLCGLQDREHDCSNMRAWV